MSIWLTLIAVRKVCAALGGLLIVAALLHAAPATAAANKITVTKFTDETPNGCTKSDCSIREALLKANKTDNAEKVILPAGIYQINSQLEITRPVKIAGDVADTQIEQLGTDRVLYVHKKGTLNLSGVSITGGDTSGEGGGIFAEGAKNKLTIVQSAVSGNSADSHGGGISAHGPLVLTESLVRSNDTDRQGGGIWAGGHDVTITRSDVSLNVARVLSGGEGGGGIAFTAPGTLRVIESSISGNNGGIGAGGIDVEGGEAGVKGANFTLLRSLVNGNFGGRGGGLFIFHGIEQRTSRFLLQDSTITSNSVTGEAGGLWCACPEPEAQLVHLTITNNRADSDNNESDPNLCSGCSGGGFINSGNQFALDGSIIANNLDTGAADPDCGGVFIHSLGDNVFGTRKCGNSFDPGTDEDIVANGFLGPLADNGGPTLTVALDTSDPAVDIDDGESCGGTDQRGAPRPTGSGCDAGAYELEFCDTNVVNVVGTDGKDTLFGGSGNDGILGLGGSDTITAGGGADTVCGGDGNDTISGQAGNDILHGEKGDDTLDGGTETDLCDGGPGKDTLLACE